MKSKISVLSITLIVSMIISSCSQNNKVSQNKLEPITIAQFGHVFLYMPLYVACDRGFFKDEGLDVKLVSTGGDEKTFTAVASGNAQFGVSDPTFAAIARERGQGGKVVASIVQGMPFWVVTYNNSIKNINDAKEFSGYRIATYTAPSTCYAVMKKVLSNDGHKVNATIVEGAFGSLQAVLKANQADMAQEIEPVVSIAVNQGAHIVFTPNKRFGDFAFTGLTVSDQFCKEHPEIIQHVVNALTKAMNYMNSNFDDAVLVAQTEFPDVKPEVVRLALTRLKQEGTIPNSPFLNQSAWNNAIAMRKDIGDIHSHESYKENVDMTFVSKVNK